MSDRPAGGDARAQWLERVLGVAIGGAGAAGASGGAAADGGAKAEGAAEAEAGPAPSWAAARQGWQDASEAVDGQIAGLQSALRQSGDDRLQEIAEFGLNGLTGNHKVPLMAALMGLGSGDPTTLRKDGPKALGLIEAFRAHLEGSEAVEVCDGNPFGAQVSIRATLVPALAQMAAALQAATKS